MQQRVREVYPTMTFTISLDRMIASVENANAHVQTITGNPQPPLIFVSTTPAILLFVEGKPVLASVPGTTLQYVVNTNWDLFFDNSEYFLLDGKTWIKSKDLAGPWAGTSKLPADFAKIPKGQNWDEVLKAVPAPPLHPREQRAPCRFFAPPRKATLLRCRRVRSGHTRGE